jgi:nitrate/nitrite transporter NarK
MSVGDWESLGAAAFGMALGSFLGYRLMLRREPRSRRERAWRERGRAYPGMAAAVTAFGAFFGVAVVEDLTRLLGGEKPGFALVKYLFAAAIGITHYAYLRRLREALPES